MATQKEIAELKDNWARVIKQHYPDITVVVKGDGNTVVGLLSNWHTGDVTKEKPTEVELLNALALIKAQDAKALLIRQGILAKVGLSIGKEVAQILIDENAKGDLLMALLMAIGAFDENGQLRSVDVWLDT